MRFQRILFRVPIAVLIFHQFFFLPSKLAGAADAKVIVNPLMRVGPDPWVEYKDGYY